MKVMRDLFPSALILAGRTLGVIIVFIFCLVLTFAKVKILYIFAVDRYYPKVERGVTATYICYVPLLRGGVL